MAAEALRQRNVIKAKAALQKRPPACGGRFMSSKANNFVWYELMTTDVAAAEAFYCAVIGWNAQHPEIGRQHQYTLVRIGENGVAGMMTMPEEAVKAGGRPGWVGYIGVDDTDSKVGELAAKGCKIYKQPTDIPDVGRFAVVADPQGAVFMLFTPAGEAPADTLAPNAPGTVGWRELYAGDGATAFDFYAGQFGWTKGESMDMGEMGVYQLFAAGSHPVGAIMTKPANIPTPFWNFYFVVDEINAGLKRVTDHGGTVVMGPMEVPGGTLVAQCTDPEGLLFSLMAMPAATKNP
jgi:predicted enzyme related to lactoylglutathione lyase